MCNNTTGEIVVFSRRKELKKVLKSILNSLKPYKPSNDFKLKLNLVVEEIFLNIIEHGYKMSEDNEVKISYIIEEDPKAINIVFADKGILFNPLKYVHDIKSYIENIDCEKSGLGLIIMKNNVDEISYKTENNYNILNIKKIIK